MISKTLTWMINGTAAEQAKADVEAAEQNLWRLNERSEQLPGIIEIYRRMSEALNTYITGMTTDADTFGDVVYPGHNHLRDALNNVQRTAFSLANDIIACEQDIPRLQERITSAQTRLNSARMALALAKPPKVFTLHVADIRKPLSRIGAKNVRLNEDTRSSYKRIEATFDDIVLTPASVGTLPFWVKCVGTNTPSVRLPPLKVAVHPTTQNVLAKRLRGINGYISGFSRHPVAHPHVTSSNGALCLGDWGGVLMESIDQQDWTTTFDVLKQFLRSANHQDPAGKTWVNYLSRGQNISFSQTMTESWIYCPNTAPRVYDMPSGEPKYGYLIFTGNGNFQWFLHDKPNEWPDISIKPLDAPPATIITELPEHEELADADPDEPWRDDEGYDQNGYDENGVDREGYDRAGYDEYGYNRAGYNRDGYNDDGYDEDGYNEYGYNEDGYDRDGYDENGYDENGYNRAGVHCDSEAA